MGNAQRRGKSLRTSGAFGMGVFACTIDTNPLVISRIVCITGMKKLKRGCRKSRTPFIMLFRSWGANLDNCSENILALKISFARIHM